jgi:hypothetical protein
VSAADGGGSNQWRADVCTQQRIRKICDIYDELADELITYRAAGLLPADLDPRVHVLAAWALRQRLLDRDRSARRRMVQLSAADRAERLRLARAHREQKPKATLSEIARAIARKQKASAASIEKFLRRNRATWCEKKSGHE